MEWLVIAVLFFTFVALIAAYSLMATGADYPIQIAKAMLLSLFVYTVTQIYSNDTNWLVHLLWAARSAAFLSLTSWIVLCVLFVIVSQILDQHLNSGGYRTKFAILLIEPLYSTFQDVLTIAIAAQYTWGSCLFISEGWIIISSIPYVGRVVILICLLDVLGFQLVLLRYALGPVVVLLIGLKDMFQIVEPYLLGRSSRTFLNPNTLLLEYRKEAQSKAATRNRIILAISDTHMASKDGYIYNNPTGRTSAHTKQFIVETIQATRPDAIVHCGDVTDAGDYFAWEITKQAFEGKKVPFLAVPGNHDVNLARLSPGYDLLGSVHSRSAQDERAVKYFSRMMRPLELDDHPYPVVYRDDELSLIFVLFDSNKRVPMTPFSNALGMVGGQQLWKAEKLVEEKRRSHDALVIVLHHHVLIPSFKDAMLRSVDSEDVIRFAFKVRASCIIHGHKHMPYTSVLEKGGHSLIVVSCGSAHHQPQGKFKCVVRKPSCYAIDIADNEPTAGIRPWRREPLFMPPQPTFTLAGPNRRIGRIRDLQA